MYLNWLVKKYDLNMIYISGPGHGAPATLSNADLQEKIRYEDQSDSFLILLEELDVTRYSRF